MQGPIIGQRGSSLVLVTALAACDPRAKRPPDADEDSPPNRVELTAVHIEAVERPLEFVRAPMIGLQRIDSWTPDADQRWPPLNSKSGEGFDVIWSSEIVAAAEHYWIPSSRGWIALPRDLDPAHARLPSASAEPAAAELLGSFGDQVISAVAGRRIDIYAALDHAPDDRWYVVSLDWPARALNRELSAWYAGVGPALAGDELVILGERSLVHASILDGVAYSIELDHEPHGLTVGERKAAWHRELDGRSAWCVALDDFARIVCIPGHGQAAWVGDSLVIWDHERAIRWTESRTVALELPLSSEQRRFGDGEQLWLVIPERGLWRVDEHGYFELDLALPWAHAARASGGALIWEVPEPERMVVYSTEFGAGPGLDRGALEAGE